MGFKDGWLDVSGPDGSAWELAGRVGSVVWLYRVDFTLESPSTPDFVCVVSLDLRTGRVMGRPVVHPITGYPWVRGVPSSGGLLLSDGSMVRRVSETAVLWEVPGDLIAASDVVALVGSISAPDELHIISAMTGQTRGTINVDRTHLRTYGSAAVTMEEIAVSLGRDMRIFGLNGDHVETRQHAPIGVFVSSALGKLVVCEPYRAPEGIRSRITGAVNADVPGFILGFSGSGDGFVAVSSEPAQRGAVVTFATSEIRRTVGLPSAPRFVHCQADSNGMLATTEEGVLWFDGTYPRR